MRTALLAANKRTSTGQLRAELVLGGRSVLGWQVDLVRALGCERLICLCDVPTAEVLTLQREIESAGGTFHAVRGPLQLAGLVHADDELVMMLDGLYADTSLVAELAGLSATTDDDEGSATARLAKVIATIPATHQLAEANPEDFERIDRDRHWAGLATMRAAHVHKLADLPPDGDAMSLLLRLALQARVECSELDASGMDSGKWMLATDGAALAERETALIEDRRQNLSNGGLGGALAARIVTSIAPRWLANGSEVSAGGALALGAGASGLAIWGLLGQGGAATGLASGILALAALSAFTSEISTFWGNLRKALWPRARAGLREGLLRGLIDVMCVIALIFAHSISPNPAVQIAVPILAIGLTRLAGEAAPAKWAGIWRDRTLQMVGFAALAAGGVLSEALALFTLGALAQLMLRARGN